MFLGIDSIEDLLNSQDEARRQFNGCFVKDFPSVLYALILIVGTSW